ncbi:MAG: tRNA 2-thiouridine(34) synthase MnmA [Oscillospiraceae bacterium]|nr:tRNA 2-thiouridine(34) synthase MnmA [Oscillospiraceae bacterium]
MAERVVLGLSGGVDSSVAALRLRSAGYEVHAVYLDMGMGGAEEAADTARQVGVPFTVVDTAAALEERVCAPFRRDYLAGRTPIPCARCNPTVKFPALLAHADEIGAKYVATGHYARIGMGTDGGPVLLRGMPANDQSYMLARLPRPMLERLLFPLGEVEKTDTRREAAAGALSAAQRPDSMDICFIPDGDYARWLEERGETPPPGNFVDMAGNVLGRHKGIHHYTLGQRRGLGIPSTGRLFVAGIRPDTNEVVLSHGEGLHASRVVCGGLNWLAPGDLDAPRRAAVRLRHSRREDGATLIPLGEGQVELRMDAPARAPTPGQLAVFYDGDLVLGSGWIEGAE